MIWLRKKQDDMQTNSLPNTMIKYFKDGMETFDQYYSRFWTWPNFSPLEHDQTKF